MKQPNPFRKKVGAAVLVTSLLIAGWEGFREEAYIPVPGDVPTLGSGFTKHEDGTPVQLGDKITKEENARRLLVETNEYQQKIAKCIKVPLSEGEVSAFTSLSFNIGTGAFCKSTLVKKLNEYDYEGACKEILRWNRFKGKVLLGLDNRRKDEYSICIGDKVLKVDNEFALH